MNRNDLSAEEHVTIMIGVRKKACAAVLLKNSKKLSRKGSIMKPNWTGLYHIHEATGKNTYKLSRFKGTNKERPALMSLA